VQRDEKYRFPSDGRKPERAFDGFLASCGPLFPAESRAGYRFPGVEG
jgi:hypothetical protein